MPRPSKTGLWYRCKSDPQMAVRSTVMIAESGRDTVGSATSSTVTDRSPCNTTARTAPHCSSRRANPIGTHTILCTRQWDFVSGAGGDADGAQRVEDLAGDVGSAHEQIGQPRVRRVVAQR